MNGGTGKAIYRHESYYAVGVDVHVRMGQRSKRLGKPHRWHGHLRSVYDQGQKS